MPSLPRYQPGPGRQEKPPAILERSMAVSFPLASCCCAPETKGGPTERTVIEVCSRLAYSSVARYQASTQEGPHTTYAWTSQTRETCPTGFLGCSNYLTNRTQNQEPGPLACCARWCVSRNVSSCSVLHVWASEDSTWKPFPQVGKDGGCPSLGPGEFIGGECFNKVQEVGEIAGHQPLKGPG